MRWHGFTQCLSYCVAELYEKLGALEEAERHYQAAAVYGTDEWTASLALQSLGSLWKSRDASVAASFYRWSARHADEIPAIPYVELYQCLLEAGQREQIVGEIEELERLEPKGSQDLQRLAAAKQAVGEHEEADRLWAECLREIRPRLPRWIFGNRKAHIEIAREMRHPTKDPP
jgi:tetratricopeptide (TPR) repeat protein